MAVPPASLFSRQGIIRMRIDGCLVNIDGGDAQQSLTEATVSLHIAHSSRRVPSCRLRVSVSLQTEPEPADIFLDIPPDRLISLSLHQPSESASQLVSESLPQLKLHLVVASPGGNLIAPQAPKTLSPATLADKQVLEVMRVLSQSRTITLHLPPNATLFEHLSTDDLSALCDIPESLKNGSMQSSSLAQLDLKTFYRGRGGRIVPPDEAFAHPGTITTGGHSGDEKKSSSASIGEHPPSYTEAVPPTTPGPSTSPRKRPRTNSVSSGSQDHGGKGSNGAIASLGTLHDFWRQADMMVEKLQASTTAAAAMDAKLRATMVEAEKSQHLPPPLRTSTSLSPGRTDAGSGGSSVSEVLSERLRAYLDERLKEFRQDMQEHYNSRLERRLDESLADYSTIEHTEEHVATQIEEMTVDFIEESQMWDAIQEAVDKVEQDIRTRMLDAWSD